MRRPFVLVLLFVQAAAAAQSRQLWEAICDVDVATVRSTVQSESPLDIAKRKHLTDVVKILQRAMKTFH